MKRILQVAGFVAIFFLGNLVVNFYLFQNLSKLFDLPINGNFYLLIVLSALFYPVASVLERILSDWVSGIFYALAASWVGVSFFLLWGVIIHQILGQFFHVPPMMAGGLIISVTLLVSGYSIYNALQLKIKKLCLTIPGLTREIKAVQLSDVHLGPIRNHSFLRNVVEQSNRLNPDVVFITGDLFDGSSQIDEKIIKELNRFRSPVFFTPGNHDYFQGLNEVCNAISHTRIRLLRNQVYQFGELQVVGVDYSYQKGYLKKTLDFLKIDKNKPTILLYHLPDGFDEARKAGVDLQLSGHTHNGQFFPFNFLVKLRFPYLGGLYKNSGSCLHVSPGTGTWGPPMRWGSRCEVTSLLLKPI
ncbi:MAG: metallophosphoesterase [Euryarchaeota archaeon]|jgi:predicted MPP superfamily phosphohydrolase|nr:metallophosphoesterase [Euryarchaeota archaeon]